MRRHFQKQKTGRETTGLTPAFLATCLTWLQADRPNHHGIKLQYCVAALASIPGVWFCLATVNEDRNGARHRDFGRPRNCCAVCLGTLKSEKALDDDQIQPASLDLRLGSKAFRVRRASCPVLLIWSPTSSTGLKLHVVDLSEGAVLETGCVYIVPLMESLSLPADMSASANPKSSTGRLAIFTPRDYRQGAGVRQDPGGLQRTALSRNQPANLSDRRQARFAAFADTLPHRPLGSFRAGAAGPARKRRASSPVTGRTFPAAALPFHRSQGHRAGRPDRLPRQASHIGGRCRQESPACRFRLLGPL